MERRGGGLGVTGWPVGLLNRTPFKANSTHASAAPLVSLPPLFLFSLSLSKCTNRPSLNAKVPLTTFSGTLKQFPFF